MTNKTPLELLPLEEQIPELRAFLHPCRSRLRPFLALFAIKNYLLREAGLRVRNEPTVRWYQTRLVRAGVTASYCSVSHQLNRLARFGIVDKAFATHHLMRKSRRIPGLVRTEVCEYTLNEGIYPGLEQALKQLLGVDSFYSLTGLEDP